MKRSKEQPTTNNDKQQPIVVVKEQNTYLQLIGDPEFPHYEIPVWSGSRDSHASPDTSLDSAVSSEALTMTVCFSDKKYYQQSAQQVYNDTFNSLTYDQKKKIQSILKKIDQKIPLSHNDRELFIKIMETAGFTLITAAPLSLYETPVRSGDTSDDNVYAEPDSLYSKPIRNVPELNESSDDSGLGDLSGDSDTAFFGFGLDVDEQPIDNGQCLYELATDRSGDPLYDANNKESSVYVAAPSEELYYFATDRSGEPLYGAAGDNEQYEEDEENEYALATDRSKEGGVYGAARKTTQVTEHIYSMYDAIPAQQKRPRAPEPAPRQMAPPQVPIRRSLLKHNSDSSTDTVPLSLIIPDSALSRAQQAQISAILNLIKITPIKNDEQQNITIGMSINDKLAVAQKSNIIRRNLHVIIPAAIIVVSGAAAFLGYWFSKGSSSPRAVPGTPENEALAMCQNASNAALNLGLRLVNGLFSVTADQATTLCASVGVPADENCASFLTQNCTQLLSSEASSVGGTAPPYFGFFEAVSTAASTAAHAITTTVTALTSSATTLATNATTAAMSSVSTTLAPVTEAITTSVTNSTTTSSIFTTLNPIAEAITTTFSSASDMATTATTFVTDTLTTVTDTTTDALTSAATTASTMATDALSTVASTASTLASTTSTMATEALTSTASTITSTASTLASTIASTASTVTSTIASTASTTASTIASTTSSVWSTITSTTTTLFQSSSTSAMPSTSTSTTRKQCLTC